MDALLFQVLLPVLVIVVGAIWFILPAYVANMVPAILHRFFGKYNFPVDFGKGFFDGRRIFGDGKTWNGLVFGILAGGLVGLLQAYAFGVPQGPGIGAGQINGLKFGFILGAGALFGDLVKSFFKRRLNFERGKMWFPFDQIDFILGAFLFYAIFYGWHGPFVKWNLATLLVLTPILHLAVNRIGFVLKLKKEPW